MRRLRIFLMSIGEPALPANFKNMAIVHAHLSETVAVGVGDQTNFVNF